MATAGSELTKEQLLEYVKRQKVKIKKLEIELSALKDTTNASFMNGDESRLDISVMATSGGSSQQLEGLQKTLQDKDQEIFKLMETLRIEQEGKTLWKERENFLEEQLKQAQYQANEACDSLKWELQEASQVNARLREELTRVQDLIKQQQGNLQDDVLQLREQVSCMTNVNHEKDHELDVLRKQIDSFQQSESTLLQEQQHLTSALETFKEQVHKLSHSHDSQQDGIKNELEKVTVEKEAALAKLDAAHSQLLEVNQLLRTSQEQSQSSSDELEQLRCQCATLQEQFQVAEREKQDALTTAQKAQKEVAISSNKLEELEEALEAAQNTTSSLEEEMVKLKKEHAVDKTKLNDLISDLETKEQACKDALDKIGQLESQLREANNIAAAAAAAAAATGPTAVVTPPPAPIETPEVSQPAATGGNGKKGKKGKGKNNSVSVVVEAAAPAATTAVSVSPAEEPSSPPDNSEEVAKLQSVLTEKEGELQALQQQMATSEQLVADLTRQCAELKLAASEVSALKDDLSNKDNTHTQELSEMQAKLSTQEQSLVELREQVSSQHQAVQTAQQALVDTAEEHSQVMASLKVELEQITSLKANLEVSLQSKEDIIRSLQSNSSEEVVKLQTESVQLKDALEQARQQLHTSEDLLQKNTKETEQIQHQLEQAHAKIASLEAEKAALQGDQVSALTQAQDALAAKQQELTELLNQHANVTEVKASLEQTLSSAQEEVFRLKVDFAQHQSLLVAAQNEVQQWTDKCTALQQELAASQDSQRQQHQQADQHQNEQVLKLQAEITSLQSALTQAQHSQHNLEEQLTSLKTEFQQKEDMNKKLTLKLKAKMKEANDLTAALEKAQQDVDNASKATQPELAKWQRQVSELEQSNTQLQQMKQEYESKIRNLNETLLNNEERLSSLLMEKSKVREESLDLEKRLRETDILKQEKESLHDRYVELERRYHQTEVKLMEGNVLSKKQVEEIEQLQAQLKQEKTESQQKEDNNNEKIKKLKALLNKVNTLSQEKDSKLQSMESALKRPKRFQVVARVSINSQTVSKAFNASEEMWALIFVDSPPSSADGSGDGGKKLRWIETAVMEEWLSLGSSMIGSLPESIEHSMQKQYQQMKQTLEQERDDVLAKLEDISQQFQTYKVRAQTALKRIGDDERERHKKVEFENAEIERLKEMLEDVHQRNEESCMKIEVLEDSLQKVKAQLSQEALLSDELRSKLETSVHQLAHQQVLLSQLEQANHSLLESRDALSIELQSKEALLQEMAALGVSQQSVSPVEHRSPAKSASHGDNLHSITSDKVSNSPSIDHADAEHSRTTPEKITRAHSSSSTPGIMAHKPPSANNLASSATSSNSSSAHVPATPTANSKLMVFQQADHVLKENLQVLREENSNLMSEVLEMRNDIGLRDEQIAALKATVRELEASLLREQEFNASNRRLNADYLVNVIKKFLNSTDASERGKLVPVMCQILHVSADETRSITEKWTVRTGGLVGWLMPPRATVTTIGDKKSGNVGDVTYNPDTGGGIDINSTY